MIDFPIPPPDLKLIGGSMPRARHQNGWVERTGKKTKTWTGYWYEYAREEGGSERRLQRSKVLGPCSEMSKGAAEDKLRDLLRDERPPQTNATFEQLAKWYLRTNSGRWSKKWRVTMRGIFKCQILPRLGDRIATELKKSDVQQAINDIATDPASQSRSIVEKCLTHIRAVFNFAIEDELLERNPALKVELPITRRPNERFLTLEESQRLLDVASRRDRLIIRLFVVCGFRPAEFFALRVNDVNENRLRIDETAVPGEAVKREAKTEGSRADVPLPPMLGDELLTYIKAEGLTGEEFLFPSATGTAISHDNYLDRVLKKLGMLAGIDVVRNAKGEPVSSKLNHQTLRRTTGTHFQKHAELKSTQDLLRHANPTTTLKHYQKTLSEDLIAGVESWDAELRGKRSEFPAGQGREAQPQSAAKAS
jgi:integrase